jgi:dTDP-4-dehydrorhamnose 3,5-epimerase-like enzyme
VSRLDEVRWVDLHTNKDERGVLTAIEGNGGHVPFDIRRIFLVHHAVTDRGGHAHRDTDQLIVAAAGSLVVEVSDGKIWKSFELGDMIRGLYVPRMVFIQLRRFSPETVCLVLASTHYDIKRSIRTWEDYLKELEGV